MKAGFVKRLLAFLIDSVVLSIIFSIITIGYVSNNNSIEDKLTGYQDKIESGELSEEEVVNEYYNLFYNIQKDNRKDNTVNFVLYIGYFIIFGYLNKGQTIGKKLVKIKVVNNNGDTPSIYNMIFRNVFIYGLFTMLFSILFIDIINFKIFMSVYFILSYIECIIVVISFFMVLYKKDGRGLHDIIAKTKVIEEVK